MKKGRSIPSLGIFLPCYLVRDDPVAENSDIKFSAYLFDQPHNLVINPSLAIHGIHDDFLTNVSGVIWGIYLSADNSIALTATSLSKNLITSLDGLHSLHHQTLNNCKLAMRSVSL